MEKREKIYKSAQQTLFIGSPRLFRDQLLIIRKRLPGGRLKTRKLSKTSSIAYQIMISNAILRYTRQTLSANEPCYIPVRSCICNYKCYVAKVLWCAAVKASTS